MAEEEADSIGAREGFADAGGVSAAQETAWIRASQRGDDVAFNRLVLKWQKPVYNLVLRMLQHPAEAAEATQEVFLSAYRNIGRFRLDAKFSTWLYRISVNQCITRLRRRPPGIQLPLEAGSEERESVSNMPVVESHEAEIARQETRRHVHRALGFLSPEQKAVVELKFFQELTFEEIAAVVQAPLSTVKSRLYSGLEALKSRLGHLGPGRRTEVNS